MFNAATDALKTLMSFKVSVAVLFLACTMQVSAALTFSNRYRSPRNPERRIRASTRLIVLHTTEAHARSSLNKLRERGEAHYCVPEDGTVYRIVDRDRVAFHAGRSMWNGREDCDEYSIGIEVVGYHDKPITLKQISALKELVATLKKLYNLKDGQVVCHSHVAYGAPNKWQSRRHRGRKRCGMLFAMWSVRTRLGLKTRPAYDPDVRAGRLVQADPYLARVLYGGTDTMAARDAAGKDPTEEQSGRLLAGIGELFGLGGDKTPPKPKAPAKKTKAKSVPQKSGVKATPPKKQAVQPPTAADEWRSKAKFVSAKGTEGARPGSDVLHGKALPNAVPPRSVAGNFYLFPDGSYFHDDRLPKGVKPKPGTKRLIGYALAGPLAAGQSAYGMVGKAWNAPTTWYVIGGKVISGDKIDARGISKGTLIFYKK